MVDSRRILLLDDEGAEKTAADLIVRQVMRVIPIRAGIRDAELITIRVARNDHILSEDVDTIHPIWNPQPMPVNESALLQSVIEGNAGGLSLSHSDFWARQTTVEAQHRHVVPSKVRLDRLGREDQLVCRCWQAGTSQRNGHPAKERPPAQRQFRHLMNDRLAFANCRTCAISGRGTSRRQNTPHAVVTLGYRKTRAPISTRSYRSFTCSFVNRAHPFDTADPIVSGAFVP